MQNFVVIKNMPFLTENFNLCNGRLCEDICKCLQATQGVQLPQGYRATK